MNGVLMTVAGGEAWGWESRISRVGRIWLWAAGLAMMPTWTWTIALLYLYRDGELHLDGESSFILELDTKDYYMDYPFCVHLIISSLL